MTSSMVTLQLSAGRVAVVLLWVIAALVSIHAISLFAWFELGRDHQLGLLRMFNLNEEGNAPAWFSGTALLASAFLLAAAWRTARMANEAYARHWGALALIFIFLAIDEAASVHELLIEPVRALLGTSGALYFAWVIPYGLAVLAVAIAYSRFMLALPRRTALLFLGAALLFVGGALGLEMLAPYRFDWTEPLSMPVFVNLLFEETFEMLGSAMFIYALLDYLGRRNARIEFRFGDPVHPLESR